MKTLSFPLFFLCFALLSCKNDAAINLSKGEVIETSTEIPKKKIEEQFSSIDSKATLVTDKNEEAKKEVVEVPKKEPTKKSAQVKKKAIDSKADNATFVKTVVKQATPKPKKRTAEIEFEEQTFDFGEIMQGDKVDHKFTFKNTGRAPLTITEADATCGCATPSIPFMDIMPGETGYIGVSYNSVGKEGAETPQVTIYSNAGKDPILVLKLTGYVKTPEEAKAELAVKDSIIHEAKDSIKTLN